MIVNSVNSYNNLNYCNYKKERNVYSNSFIQDIGLINKQDKLYKKVDNNLYNVYFGVKYKPKSDNAKLSKKIKMVLNNITILGKAIGLYRKF